MILIIFIWYLLYDVCIANWDRELAQKTFYTRGLMRFSLFSGLGKNMPAVSMKHEILEISECNILE